MLVNQDDGYIIIYILSTELKFVIMEDAATSIYFSPDCWYNIWQSLDMQESYKNEQHHPVQT